MRRILTIVVAGATLLAGFATYSLWAQQPGFGPGGPMPPGGFPGGRGFGRGRNRGQQQPQEEAKMPTDPRLLAIHKEFVSKAEKLAGDYEKAKELDKARTCYEEILKLVPKYPPAVEALQKLRDKEFSAEKKSVDIYANKGLQDTGIDLVAGKPVRIEVTGSWTFVMNETLGPDGMEIPENLRNFNLGALFGVVETGNKDDAKPFLIGSQYEFTAEKSGRLMLGMWDSKHSDNAGKLDVTIRGTFDTGKSTASRNSSRTE